MTSEELFKLKFPIGEFSKPNSIDQSHIDAWIKDIENFPSTIINLCEKLSVEQKNWKYRPEGWKVKQVVHHCTDSHMNSIIRFKLCLTEDNPTIRPYYENRWAELIDSQDDKLAASIQLITGLHSKWCQLLRNISSKEMKREYIHPEHGQKFAIDEAIGLYAWHCNHHIEHIRQALNAQGKYN